jgi:hypothetical protein
MNEKITEYNFRENFHGNTKTKNFVQTLLHTNNRKYTEVKEKPANVYANMLSNTLP